MTYRLMLCRDKTPKLGVSVYVLFGGTKTPQGMFEGFWQDYSGCVRLSVWVPRVFHKLSTIRMRPGAGPRDVTLAFADKELTDGNE